MIQKMNELIDKIKENWPHYLVLVVILTIGLIFFWTFRYVQAVQLWVLILTDVVFVIWGVIHHYLVGDLNQKVVFDYLSTAFLGFMVIWFLLLRA